MTGERRRLSRFHQGLTTMANYVLKLRTGIHPIIVKGEAFCFIVNPQTQTAFGITSSQTLIIGEHWMAQSFAPIMQVLLLKIFRLSNQCSHLVPKRSGLNTKWSL